MLEAHSSDLEARPITPTVFNEKEEPNSSKTSMRRKNFTEINDME